MSAPPRPRILHPILNYLLAALSVGLALVGAQTFENAMGSGPPLVSLFLCAIMFIAFVGGTGPALFATALSLLAFVYFFLPPLHSLALGPMDLPRIAVFGVAALFVVALNAAQKRTADLLRRVRDQQDATLAELARLNETLRIENAERGRAEEALRRSEARLVKARQELQDTIDTIPTLVSSYAPDGKRDFVNAAWKQFTGLTDEQALNKQRLDHAGSTLDQGLGWAWRAAIHPDDWSAVIAAWKQILVTGEPIEVEARMRRHDGEYRWFLFRPAPLRDELGRVIKWYGTNTDIEDRKRAELALQRSEAYLAEAQKLSATGSFGWEIATGALYWSDETYKIMGFERWVKPSLALVMERVHPEDRAAVQREVDRVASDDDSFDFEHRLLMPDGQVKHMVIRSHRVRYVSGKEEIVGALMDVTQARRAQEALHAAEVELAHANRVATLGEISTSIAHEVNQPLAAIVANGEACLRFLARESPDLSDVRDAVEWIIKDGNRASDVINRVRALTKKSAAQRIPLNINEAINDVLVLLQRELISHRVTLQRDLAPDLPQVAADRVQIQQVIINLLMNGLEAMRTVGEQSRILSIRSRQGEAGDIEVSVIDRGTGIGADAMGPLFDAFFSTKPEGLGIGLSICRSIVEAHGGRIRAIDSPVGATFLFTLPACKPEFFDPGASTQSGPARCAGSSVRLDA